MGSRNCSSPKGTKSKYERRSPAHTNGMCSHTVAYALEEPKHVHTEHTSVRFVYPLQGGLHAFSSLGRAVHLIIHLLRRRARGALLRRYREVSHGCLSRHWYRHGTGQA